MVRLTSLIISRCDDAVKVFSQNPSLDLVPGARLYSLSSNEEDSHENTTTHGLLAILIAIGLLGLRGIANVTEGLCWERTTSPPTLFEQAFQVLPCSDPQPFTIDPPPFT